MAGYEIARDLGDRHEQGWALIYASQAYRRLGDHERAWQCSDRATRLFDPGHDGHLQASVTRAHTVYDLGRPAEALAGYRAVLAALAGRTALNATLVTRLIAHICIARCLAALDRWAEVAGTCEEALHGPEPLNVDRLEGDLRLWLGRARRRLGEPDEARAELDALRG
jgi:tetratricopeptide (TPR) repeat protein